MDHRGEAVDKHPVLVGTTGIFTKTTHPRIRSELQAQLTSQAEIEHQKAVDDIELRRARALAEIEAKKFKDTVLAINADTIKSMRGKREGKVGVEITTRNTLLLLHHVFLTFFTSLNSSNIYIGGVL